MPCPSPGLEPQLPQLGKIRIRGRELLRLDNLLSASSLETWTVQITDHFHFQGMKMTVSNAYFACKAFPLSGSLTHLLQIYVSWGTRLLFPHKFKRKTCKAVVQTKKWGWRPSAKNANLPIWVPDEFPVTGYLPFLLFWGRLQTPRQLETLGSKVKWEILNRETPTTPNNEETGFSNNFK